MPEGLGDGLASWFWNRRQGKRGWPRPLPALWAPCYFSKTRTQENRTRAGYNRFDLALDPVVLLNFARPPLIIQAL